MAEQFRNRNFNWALIGLNFRLKRLTFFPGRIPPSLLLTVITLRLHIIIIRAGVVVSDVLFNDPGPRAPPFVMNYENAGSLKPVHSMPPGK